MIKVKDKLLLIELIDFIYHYQELEDFWVAVEEFKKSKKDGKLYISRTE